MKQKKNENQMPTRKDSLIKSYVVEEINTITHKYKVTFTTVKDIDLVFLTSTQTFMDGLKNFESKFVISYEFSRTAHKLVEENEKTKRIIKVKLPKLPKK